MFNIIGEYPNISVAIADNEYFQADRWKGFTIELKMDEKGNKKLIVNNRELKEYEWKFEMDTYHITLKHWL